MGHFASGVTVVTAVTADVSTEEGAEAVAAVTGSLDVLVHNASTLGPTPLPLLLDTPGCPECSPRLRPLTSRVSIGLASIA